MMKITVNLVEVMTEESRHDHAPLVFQFERPDSLLRLMAFALGTTYYFSFSTQDGTDKRLDEAMGQCWRRTVELAASVEGQKFAFSGPLDVESALLSARADVTRAVEGWKDYARHFVRLKASGVPLNRDEHTARMVSAMLRHVESSNPMREADAVRLDPLSRWLEVTTMSIRPALKDLIK